MRQKNKRETRKKKGPVFTFADIVGHDKQTLTTRFCAKIAPSNWQIKCLLFSLLVDTFSQLSGEDGRKSFNAKLNQRKKKKHSMVGVGGGGRVIGVVLQPHSHPLCCVNGLKHHPQLLQIHTAVRCWWRLHFSCSLVSGVRTPGQLDAAANRQAQSGLGGWAQKYNVPTNVWV